MIITCSTNIVFNKPKLLGITGEMKSIMYIFLFFNELLLICIKSFIYIRSSIVFAPSFNVFAPSVKKNKSRFRTKFGNVFAPNLSRFHTKVFAVFVTL